MADKLPKITEGDVQQLSNAKSFERGFQYYRRGAIREPVQQGNELRGYCEGSDYEPYRVTATLGKQGLETIACTCPYDWGGICKHSVALLLTWVHQPDKFHTLAPLDELLTNRSQEELILLIKEMLKREPDLARLLELPVQPDRNTPLDLDAFRRQIKYALSRGNDYDDYHGYYGGADDVATELSAVVDTADRFREGSDWANAGAIYSLVLSEIVPKYEELYDENGDVAIELQRCAEGLESCFSAGQPEAEARREWLTALLEAHIADIELGGIDLAHPAGQVVIEQATNEEWVWIEARVQKAIAGRTDRYSSWGREALVGFLAGRLEKTGQSGQMDELIFEQGSPRQKAFLLIEQARFNEAVDIARANFTDLPGLVDQFAEALVKAGAGDKAVTFMVSLLNTRNGSSYMTWLANYAEQEGDLTASLDWQRQSMRQSPRLDTYTTIRRLAQQLDQWSQVQPVLLKELEAKEAWQVLLDIALDEDDIDRAIELLPRLKGWFSSNYEIKVARAAEKKRPEFALTIYQRQAERLINARGRDNYRTAAEWLTRVRAIQRDEAQQTEWQTYIRYLRHEYSNLPALQDELNKAGL